jgi:hypothetical protein
MHNLSWEIFDHCKENCLSKPRSGGGNLNIYLDFEYKVDKRRVINSVASYYDLPPSEIVDRRFKKLNKDLYDLIEAKGIFRLDEKPLSYNFEVLEECDHIFFCAITLGDNSTKRVDELFNSGEIFDAVLLDSMASMLLFEYTRQLYYEILIKAREKKVGLTCRVSPGDGEIPLEYQRDILSRIGDAKKHGIFIERGFLLCPQKSMTFIYGAGRNINLVIKDHDCLRCNNINCSMREI